MTKPYAYAALAATAAVDSDPTHPDGTAWPEGWNFPLDNAGVWPPGWPPDITEPTVYMSSSSNDYHSNDGGTTITKTASPAHSNFQDMWGTGHYMYATQTPGGGGNVIDVYLSLDGGYNWEKRGTATPSNGSSVHNVGITLASGRIIIPGGDGVAIYSDNAGVTFSESDTGAGTSAEAGEILQIADGTVLYFVYGAGLTPNNTTYTSADNGATWADAGGTPIPNTHRPYYTWAPDNGSTVVYAHSSSSSYIYLSTDSGVTMTLVKTITGSRQPKGLAGSGTDAVLLHSLSPSPYTIGSYYTENSGATWAEGTTLTGETHTTMGDTGRHLAVWANGYVAAGNNLWGSTDVTGFAKLNTTTDMSASVGTLSSS